MKRSVEMHLGVIPGLPAGDVRNDEPRSSVSSNGVYNPYAGQAKRGLTRLVYPGQAQALKDLAADLKAAGFGVVSEAELLRMILHDSMPVSVEEAAKRLRAWALVLASGPRRDA